MKRSAIMVLFVIMVAATIGCGDTKQTTIILGVPKRLVYIQIHFWHGDGAEHFVSSYHFLVNSSIVSVYTKNIGKLRRIVEDAEANQRQIAFFVEFTAGTADAPEHIKLLAVGEQGICTWRDESITKNPDFGPPG